MGKVDAMAGTSFKTWNEVAFDLCRCMSRRASLLISSGVMLFLTSAPALAQISAATWHYDNALTSANTSESILTPSNVNSASFGKLFTLPVDGFVVGQPLYLPSVSIPGQGVHNVVYVATMHESVYAFDADSGSGAPLWVTSIFSYSPAGATSVPATVKKDPGTTGWTELGIVSTPVIDPVSNTL